ncbi:MAG: hypothetical protein JW722_05000 [Demequinaceae bacterium]|nr:hypothetical protein [Demequinaceae bacterium]
MARPTKNATAICLVLSVLAVIGIAIGLATSTPLVIVFALIPTVVYEIYRVEGESTKWSSWGMGAVLVALLSLHAVRRLLEPGGMARTGGS